MDERYVENYCLNCKIKVIDRFVQQVSPMLSEKGVLYLLLVKENKPDEVAQLIHNASRGRLSKHVCVLKRQCKNEHLAVYRFFNPLFFPACDCEIK